MARATDDIPGPEADLSWLDKGGETGALIRAFDWSTTELGSLDSWPQSLRTATALLLLSPVPIVLLWGEPGYMIYNDAYSGFAGARHPALLGSEVRSGWAEIADFNDNVMRVGLAGGTLAYRDQALTLVRKGKPEPVWMDLDYSPVLDESGKPGGVISIVVETTERVLAEAALRESERRFREALEAKVEERTAALMKAEQALMQSQKMEALGSLTGGIAHDFNNLLMAIQGSLELLRERIPADPFLHRFITNALSGVERGSGLTRRMLAFARRQDLKAERLDVRLLIDGMTELMQRSLGTTIIIETDIADGLAAVEADANQLESALLNLAVNARDAMDGAGCLSIHARNATLSARQGALLPGAYVVLSITDSGMGMDDATLHRATEPFFTTKGVGKGTGLGLSMVHGLAEQLGGALQISSRIGVGTTAAIWLPAAALRAEPVASVDIPTKPHAPITIDAALTILNVDDDELVRSTSMEMLEDLGYRVLPASSGAEALRLLETQKVDLVLTDHAMPRMTGMELAVQLRERFPEMPVIIATGYSELVEDAHIDLPRLAKPYSQAALAELVTQAIRRAG
jgi:signal transduction histidine kinase